MFKAGTIQVVAIILIVVFTIPSEAQNGAYKQRTETQRGTETSQQTPPAPIEGPLMAEPRQPIVVFPTYYLEENSAHDETPGSFLWVPWDGWVAIFTLVLAAVSIWQGCQIRRGEHLTVAALRSSQRQSRAAIRAAHAAEATVDKMQDTAERQLRAYITLDEGKLFNVGTNAEWYAIVKIKNGGQTPAYDVRTHGSIEGDFFPITKPILPIPEESKDAGQGVLGADAEYILKLPIKGTPTAHHTRAMIDGKGIVWVSGRITYRDIFGKPRWTTFRAFSGGELGYDPDGVFAPYTSGNDGN